MLVTHGNMMRDARLHTGRGPGRPVDRRHRAGDRGAQPVPPHRIDERAIGQLRPDRRPGPGTFGGHQAERTRVCGAAGRRQLVPGLARRRPAAATLRQREAFLPPARRSPVQATTACSSSPTVASTPRPPTRPGPSRLPTPRRAVSSSRRPARPARKWEQPADASPDIAPPRPGFTMIEILVTLVVTAVGMLGLAGFVVRATTLSTDSIQRARAAVLVNDMAARISNGKAIAANLRGRRWNESAAPRRGCRLLRGPCERPPCSCASGTTCSPARTMAAAEQPFSGTAAA